MIVGVGITILCFIVVNEFDLIVKLAGIGGVEDGDSAAAGFGEVVGGVHGFEELAESFEASVCEFVGVWRHGDPRGKVCMGAAGKKRPLYKGAEIQICARKAAHRRVGKARKCLSGLGEENLRIPWEGGLSCADLRAQSRAKALVLGC